MSHRRLDRVDLVFLSHAYQFACSNAALCYRLIKRQYFDLAATIATLAKSTVATIGPEHEDLVAFSRYQNLLCVHSGLVYNRP